MNKLQLALLCGTLALACGAADAQTNMRIQAAKDGVKPPQ